MKDRVQDVMTRLVVTLRPEDPVHEAAAKLARHRISGAPVVEDDRVVGVVSETDLVDAALPRRERRAVSLLGILDAVEDSMKSRGLQVTQIMNQNVTTITPDASVWDAACLMQRRRVNRLPVVDEAGYLIGIVTRADLVAVFGRPDEAIEADVADTLGILGPEAIRDLELWVVDGVVTLHGRADRRSTKEIAAALVERIPGVSGVKDELTYDSDDSKEVKPWRGERDPWATGPLVKVEL